MKRLLIRADDLGYCEAVNYGIEKSVKEGLVRSVGLMPNMESAAHGVSLLRGTGVCLGQHTNICSGVPLTAPDRIPSLVQPGGAFKTAQEYRKAESDLVDPDEALLEIDAQYRRFYELAGHKPDYLEAHAVASENFEKALRIFAEKEGLHYLTLNMKGPVPFRDSLVYTRMDSVFPNYDPFESLKKAALTEVGPNGCPVLLCHPGYVDDYVLKTSIINVQRAQELAMLISAEAKDWIQENEIQLVSYNDL